MKTGKLAITLLLAVTCFQQWTVTHHTSTPSARATETYFKQEMLRLHHSLQILQHCIRSKSSEATIRTAFRNSRLAYKKVEFLFEYYYPYLVRRVNGPALPFADGENSKEELPPEGFQVIEEKLFPQIQPAAYKTLPPLITRLQQHILSVAQQQDDYGFQDVYIFDAMRFEMYRLITLGMSGFDSPIAQYSLQEAAAALEGLRQVSTFYQQSEQPDSLYQRCTKAITLLRKPIAFNQFDRLEFITYTANPISESLLQLQQQLGLTLPPERRLLRPDAPHLFASGYYDPNVYSPNTPADATPEKVSLGHRLFNDPLLSGNGLRSCATCHQPQKAFTDGLPKSKALGDTSPVSRNAPTLWNAAFQPKQFYDSRAVFMEHQVFDVVHNNKEMGGSLENAATRIRKDSTYLTLFHKAFSYTNEEVCADNIANAIAAYMRSLISLDSRFDQCIQGNKDALSPIEKKGFNIFMGKGKCGSCHFLPFFNGVAPPYFAEAESEVLGVPASTSKRKPTLDPDPGKYNLYHIPIQRFAFKTPTLRNIALTPPYMHNGVYNTLEEVVDFYNDGGGAGLGIAPDNQTLPPDKLGLTTSEKTALIAFMKALTDTTHPRSFLPPVK